MAEGSDNKPGTSHQSLRASVARNQLSRNIEAIQGIKAEKYAEHIIESPDDAKHCNITGLSITPDGRRLLVDNKNRKIKMFSRDMKIICFLSMSRMPWDIAVTGDREAVVSVGLSTLFILDISGKQMFISRTVRLAIEVHGIATHKDKLVVTSIGSSASVSLIDHRGEVYWSTFTDQQGQQLFSLPLFVACYDDGRSSTVIVTDHGNKTLTVLDSNTGSVIRRRQVEGKVPRGVTTDPAGNVFVRYLKTDEVAVWTRDLSEEKILLTQHDGYWHPVIAYDTEDDKLLVIHDIKDQ